MSITFNILALPFSQIRLYIVIAIIIVIVIVLSLIKVQTKIRKVTKRM